MPISSMLDSILNKKAEDFSAEFKAIMNEKVAAALETKRVEIAQTMFVPKQAQVEEETLYESDELNEWAKAAPEDEHGAQELFLHGVNTHKHDESAFKNFIPNLQKKVKKGTYDHEKAADLWKYHADHVAKDYEKVHGGKFSVATRKLAAKHFRDHYHEDVHGYGVKNEEVESLHEYFVHGTVNGKKFKASTPDVYAARDIHAQNKHLTADEAKAIEAHTETDRFTNGETHTSIQNGHKVSVRKNGGNADSEDLDESTIDDVLINEALELHLKKGAFHKWLGKAEGEKITSDDINRGLKSDDSHARKMAQFAKNARNWHHEEFEIENDNTLDEAEYAKTEFAGKVGKYWKSPGEVSGATRKIKGASYGANVKTDELGDEVYDEPKKPEVKRGRGRPKKDAGESGNAFNTDAIAALLKARMSKLPKAKTSKKYTEK